MTTINDIAKKASVGVGTVSRVLSGKGSVAEKTRRRVLQVMSDLNYRPNGVARSLATRRTNTVGIMVPDFHGRYFGRIITAAQRNLQTDGRHILVASSVGGVAEELAAIDHLRAWECDGLMLYSRAMSDEAIIALIKSYPNVAVINRRVDEVAEHCFCVDHRYGGVLAAKRLLAGGHEAIACITGPGHVADARERQAGFESMLAEAGSDPSRLIKLEGDYNYRSGALCMEKLWGTKKGKFTAVFCGNDEMAIGAMFKLIELGVRLPEEVSIIGYDNANLSMHTFPKLTTILNPMDEIAQNAANYIQNVCYNDSKEVQNFFMPELVERDSVHSIG
ncbi:MAG: LacI family DNA-binding transcriptional regulator [Rhodomicrobiaceae bacterium]